MVNTGNHDIISIIVCVCMCATVKKVL